MNDSFKEFISPPRHVPKTYLSLIQQESVMKTVDGLKAARDNLYGLASEFQEFYQIREQIEKLIRDIRDASLTDRPAKQPPCEHCKRPY